MFEQFLLLSECFQKKPSAEEASESVYMRERLKRTIISERLIALILLSKQRVEQIVEKEDNARFKQFLFLHNIFKSPLLCKRQSFQYLRIS